MVRNSLLSNSGDKEKTQSKYNCGNIFTKETMSNKREKKNRNYIRETRNKHNKHILESFGFHNCSN